MDYISTRGNFRAVKAAEAIKLGMVPEGGLFVPTSIPKISLEEIEKLMDKNYQEVAVEIIGKYLTDYTLDEIRDCVDQAYNQESFGHPDVAPLVKLTEEMSILELWHGPTAAFKDMALQILPHFLSKAIKKVGSEKEIVILVATSGDTGKAALEGFKNVAGIKIIVFFPHHGVSKVQELQMTTTDGNNTYVVAINGNFDDCQSAVKEIFADKDFVHKLSEEGFELSSANSINWGRLLPQIVYYFWAYLGLVKKGELELGERMNIVVPTGNFGNILAGYYANQMGLPINKFICASNENKVLTDFLNEGVYDRRREFFKTNSPSMDILISSNLERFLFEITGHDGQKVDQWFEQLKEDGIFEIDADSKAKIQAMMLGDFASDADTLTTIKETFESNNYLLDTHTAIAVKVYQDYLAKTGDQTKTVVDATANPYKFVSSVLEAVKGSGNLGTEDEFMMLEELEKISGLKLHIGLQDLNKKLVHHEKVSEKTNIKAVVEEILEEGK